MKLVALVWWYSMFRAGPGALGLVESYFGQGLELLACLRTRCSQCSPCIHPMMDLHFLHPKSFNGSAHSV